MPAFYSHHSADCVNHPLASALELAESFGDGLPDLDDYGRLPQVVRRW